MKAVFKIYRVLLSPFLHAFSGPQGGCRFHPTCSEYAEEVIQKRGFLRGLVLAVFRVLRCNPFSKGGFDPVGGS